MMRILGITWQFPEERLNIVQDLTGWEKESSDSIRKITNPGRDQRGLFTHRVSTPRKRNTEQSYKIHYKANQKTTRIFHTAQKNHRTRCLCTLWAPERNQAVTPDRLLAATGTQAPRAVSAQKALKAE